MPAGSVRCLSREPFQPVYRVSQFILPHQPRHDLSPRWTMLEPVPRAAADNPQVRIGRMPVYDEVVVRRVLVLAYAGFDQRRVFHSREAISKILSCFSQSLIVDQSLSRGRIELGPARVVRQLEAAVQVPGNSVHEAITVVRPHRQITFVVAVIACGSAEEKHILLSRNKMGTHQFRKELAQPRPAREDIPISKQL